MMWDLHITTKLFTALSNMQTFQRITRWPQLRFYEMISCILCYASLRRMFLTYLLKENIVYFHLNILRYYIFSSCSEKVKWYRCTMHKINYFHFISYLFKYSIEVIFTFYYNSIDKLLERRKIFLFLWVDRLILSLNIGWSEKSTSRKVKSL